MLQDIYIYMSMRKKVEIKCRYHILNQKGVESYNTFEKVNK